MSIMVKVLGVIDLVSACVFLALVFGISVFLPLALFCSTLLGLKGLFILKGEILSIIDLFSAVLILLSLLITLPTLLVWIPALLLLSKAAVSFL